MIVRDPDLACVVLRGVDMKPIANKKLQFRTETIMVLNPSQLHDVNGGGTPATVATSSAWCLRGTIAATKSSQNCARTIGEGLAKTPDAARKGNDWVKDKVTISF